MTPPVPNDEQGIERVLGPLGSAVMRVVWTQGESTVATTRDALNGGRANPLAYTTVMTILGRLYKRGLLVREQRGRGFVYRPAADEMGAVDELSGQAVDELLERYGMVAMRHFAERIADADPELRSQLLALAEGQER